MAQGENRRELPFVARQRIASGIARLPHPPLNARWMQQLRDKIAAQGKKNP